MRNASLSLALVSLLALGACQISSLTESEKAPVPESTTTFTGGTKQIDKSQSVISFVGKSNIINHEGKFNEYTAVLTLDPQMPADLEKASLSVEIDVASVETDAEGLTNHLKQDEFFAAAAHPKATFRSMSIASRGGNGYIIVGDLTIKGITKSVTLRAEITDDYLATTYELPREEFGIGNESYGKKLLEPIVPISVKLVFAK